MVIRLVCVCVCVCVCVRARARVCVWVCVSVWCVCVWNFHHSLRAAVTVPLLETNNISLVYWYGMEIWPVLMASTWKKLCSACSVQGQNINIFSGPKGPPLGMLWWFTLHPTSRSYWYHSWSRYLVNTDWTRRFFPLCIEFCSVSCVFTCKWALPVSHHATNSVLWSLTYWPVVTICSHFGAFANATYCARHCTRRCRSLNILTALGPSRIAPEIQIFSIFAWLVPTSVIKHNSRFWVLRCTICWSWRSIKIYDAFGRKKIAVSLWNVVSAGCSETGPNSRTSLFVDRHQSLHRGKH